MKPWFEGKVIGDVAKDGMQYKVYMPSASIQLQVYSSESRSVLIQFSDFDGNLL